MKFWQLVSIARENPEAIKDSSTCSEWAKYGEWHDDFSMIVNAQDRSKLDDVVPEGFIRSVLEKLPNHFFISPDYLRTRRLDDADDQISILEAYERFGSSSIEEALEAGSIRLPTAHKS